MRSLVNPRYTHRGFTIAIYRSGSRFSAQFVFDRDRQCIERSNEGLALAAAKQLIDEQLGVNSTDRL